VDSVVRLANVVTPVPAKDAPEKSFAAPASPVSETRCRIPPDVVAAPKGVAVAASAVGTMKRLPSAIAAAVVVSRLMTPLSSWSVRARTRSTTRQAFPLGSRPERSRTESLRRAGHRRDVRRDVLDLLLGELTLEWRHGAHAVRDALYDEARRRLRLVEIRPDRAGRAGVGERMTGDAARGLEYLVARRRVTRRRRAGGGSLSCSSTALRGVRLLDLLCARHPDDRTHMRDEEQRRHVDVRVEPLREPGTALGPRDCGHE